MKKHSRTTVLFTLFANCLWANLTITSTRVCHGVNTEIHNTSHLPKTKLVDWDLNNDGFFSDASGDSITHIFSTADTFQIRLRVTDSTGNEFFSAYQSVIVDPVPEAAFITSGLCLGSPTSFTNQTIIKGNTPITYEWDYTNDGMGDNTSMNTMFTYPFGGDFTIKLKATSDQGCKDSFVKNITIKRPPNADITVQNTCINSPVHLVNTSTLGDSPVKQTIWSFGDGTLSFDSDTATHIYYSADTFYVTLKLIDSSSCVDSIRKLVVVDSSVMNSYTLSLGNQFFEGQSNIATVTGDFISVFWSDSTVDATKTITQAGYYSYVVTSATGCIASQQFTVSTIERPTELVPANDFLTPNGDGKNDILLFTNADAFSNCVLKVYDQRGLLVYTNNNYKNDWHGDNNNAGAYYYLLHCDDTPEVKGVTNIIR